MTSQTLNEIGFVSFFPKGIDDGKVRMTWSTIFANSFITVVVIKDEEIGDWRIDFIKFDNEISRQNLLSALPLNYDIEDVLKIIKGVH